MTIGLEELRKIFEDDRLLTEMGTVSAIEIAKDRSVVRVKVEVFPEGLEFICRMSWGSVGPDSGDFQLPQVGDLALLTFIEGNEDEAFIQGFLTSKEDTIPQAAVDGHMVKRARAGTKAFLVSDTEINLVRGDTPGDERVVLGDTFKAAYSAHLQVDATHDHIGNLGYNTTIPNQTQDYLDIKASPVDDDVMLSDLTKTEK